MASNRIIQVVLGCVLMTLAFSSCNTEDVDPVISISIDSALNSRIGENGGSGLISATLNGKSTKEVRLSLTFSGTAAFGGDYTVSAQEIVIPSGQLSGSIKINALQDNLPEGDESIIVIFENPKNTVLADANPLTITISDDDIDTDKDGLSDAVDDCPLDSGAVANNGCPTGFGLIINEVLYDPSNVGLEGDANGDGIYSQTEDEYIEIFNNTSLPQDIGGFTVSDFVAASSFSTVRFTFPVGTIIPAKKAVVVFGGGTLTGTFGGATVLKCTTTSGLSLGNSGEKILFSDPSGKLLQEFDSDAQSDNPNESYTRNPDVIGNFIQHSSAVSGKLFSPGTKTDGSPF